MKRKSHERTVGTLISTVCYFVLAAFFALQASDFLQAGRRPAWLGAGCLRDGLLCWWAAVCHS